MKEHCQYSCNRCWETVGQGQEVNDGRQPEDDQKQGLYPILYYVELPTVAEKEITGFEISCCIRARWSLHFITFPEIVSLRILIACNAMN